MRLLLLLRGGLLPLLLGRLRAFLARTGVSTLGRLIGQGRLTDRQTHQ